MKKHGVPTGGPYNSTGTCKPYVFEPCEHHGIIGPKPPCDPKKKFKVKCEDKCVDGYDKTLEEDLYFGEDAYFVGWSEDKIMTEIYENGPVTAIFMVMQDLVDYKEGVYQHTTGGIVGPHCVKILGWGVENGVKYWLIANTWNTNWGMNGFFKYIRGKDHLGMELLVAAGNPKITE